MNANGTPVDVAEAIAAMLADERPLPTGTPEQIARALAAEAVGTAPSFPRTDLGNAERLAHLHGRDLAYSAGLGWRVWDGRRWAPDDSGEVMRRAKLTARAIGRGAEAAEDPETRSADRKHATASEARPRLESMIALATSEAGIACRADDFDRDPWAFNVANGTIDLRSGILRPHRREDRITRISPIAYDPLATCPTWDRVLSDVLPDAEVRALFRRFVGYCLTGSVVEHVMLFLLGAGRNGKSTVIDVLLALAGDYGTQAARDLLVARSGDASVGDASAVAALRGARLAVATELPDRRFDEGQIKALTGGDRITARVMRGDWFSFEPSHKFVIAANHKPYVRGADEGFWRRIRLVPFNVTIPPEKADKGLGDKLRTELPGVLAWAVRGCLEWQGDGLGSAAAVVAATAEYRGESDTIGQFVASALEIHEDGRITRKRLRDTYAAWCEERGEKPQNARALTDRLRALGCKETRVRDGSPSPRDGWAGVRLADPCSAVVPCSGGFAYER